ncbi:uncharacterized protein ColSpa_04094 [Colletotrichum spaethianum]|uniref:Uncharacterized protein n=1 Tax=Colletotrichum spaethianum TaxID=700344 RepID=A0AA37P0R7_9PEZI|nr:uncharacterized protein ColSpa_04094 [Colletotrichum spaethianum]GKT43913.1 hypothetical protein ColSpa_04094 [Colletotrichum spaethianum]
MPGMPHAEAATLAAEGWARACQAPVASRQSLQQESNKSRDEDELCGAGTKEARTDACSQRR